ncbi:hypothetical protein OGAPHI_003662 [Ogataea philodendri]|uniref:Uncharacterized protein n=1 Tax=Ogataea philodendri TaxID=1378263 RepID=A0A9P8P5B6_9ASCO|nr:uncharacterized protein OGAPHI_003662 [Ogataea philodendri]KAH3665477.1 hypothetical protein OGAPHI_003662 [Ogataea philodendri]
MTSTGASFLVYTFATTELFDPTTGVFPITSVTVGARMNTHLNEPIPAAGKLSSWSNESTCLPNEFRSIETSSPPISSYFLSPSCTLVLVTWLAIRMRPAQVPQTPIVPDWISLASGSNSLVCCNSSEIVVDSPPTRIIPARPSRSFGSRTLRLEKRYLEYSGAEFSCTNNSSRWPRCSLKEPWSDSTPTTTCL